MIPLIRSLTSPLLSLVFLIIASGLINTFVSVRLEMEGHGNEAIGFVVSALYLGILAGSIWLDRWISKVGHVRSFIVFAMVSAVLALAQAFWIDLYYWSALRFCAGVCTAGVFIVIESWLLIQATAAMRGAILSVYLAVFYGALSGGQLLLNLSDPMGVYPFVITASLCAASTLPLLLNKTPSPKLEPSTRLSLTQMFRLSPLGFLGGVISGMLLAAVYGLVPVFAQEVGMSLGEIGNLMAVLIFGGLAFQWPIGYLADKKSRRHVLTAASFLTAAAGIALALINHASAAALLPLVFVFGGFAFTIYPLSMAHACENLSDSQIVPATGGFVFSYGLGAIAGPILAPLAMDLLGAPGLFYFFAIIALLLVPFGLSSKPAPAPVPIAQPEEEKEDSFAKKE